MSREKEIIDALVKLSFSGRELGLDALKAAVQSVQRGPLPEHWEVGARQVLRTLSEMGFVQTKGYHSLSLTDAFMRSEPVKSARQPPADAPEKPQGRAESEGRGRLPPGDNQPGAPGGGNGGEGFREVLSHPYLFSVSTDDFNALLDAI